MRLGDVKNVANPGTELIRAFNVLETVPKGVGGIVCMRSDLSAVNRRNQRMCLLFLTATMDILMVSRSSDYKPHIHPIEKRTIIRLKTAQSSD